MSVLDRVIPPAQVRVLMDIAFREEHVTRHMLGLTLGVRQGLIKKGLLKLTDCGDYYQITRKGLKYVDMLCLTPLPVKDDWVDPRDTKTSNKD